MHRKVIKKTMKFEYMFNGLAGREVEQRLYQVIDNALCEKYGDKPYKLIAKGTLIFNRT